MNMILETPFFKAYERISRHYIFLIQDIYKYNRIDDYCTPGVIEANYHDIEKEIKELTKDKEAEKLFYGDREDSESSLIWQEILTNLYEVSADKIDAYIYSLLSPLSYILTAFELNETEKDEYVSNWLMQTSILLPEVDAMEQLLDNIEDFDDVPLNSPVPRFAIDFICKLIETCNTLGYDVRQIANTYHISIPRVVTHCAVEKTLFINSQYKIRYFPFFDRRKLSKTINAQTSENREPQPEQAFVLPPELDTPKARESFKRAEKAGFIIKASTGYKWVLTAGRGALSQLAYFCGRVYCPDNIGELPEAALDKLFGVSRIGAALTQVNNAKNPQKWRQKIDGIFED